jgi:hypothetical protein
MLQKAPLGAIWLYKNFSILIFSIIFARKIFQVGVKDNKLKNSEWKYSKIAIKVGSNVITQSDGSLK